MRGLGADEPYWRALEAGRFEMQRCAGCDEWHWPAVWRCSACSSWEQRWVPVPLVGAVFSWTRTWHDFGAAREHGLPFISVVVSLDAAAARRVLGTLVHDSPAIQIGARVEGHIDRIDVDGRALPVLRWRLSSGEIEGRRS